MEEFNVLWISSVRIDIFVGHHNVKVSFFLSQSFLKYNFLSLFRCQFPQFQGKPEDDFSPWLLYNGPASLPDRMGRYKVN